MKTYSNQEDGYTMILTLSLIIVLMLTLSGAALLSSAWKSRINALARHYNAIKESDEILKKLTKSIQILSSDECDTFETENYNYLLSEYSDYSLTLKDVSSGINTKFWSKKITESNSIQKFLLNHEETEYSWLSQNLCNADTLSEALDSTGTKQVSELFPLVNSLPLMNIYALDEEFISVILESLKIKESERKTKELFAAIKTSQINDKKIANIISVAEDSQTLSIFGTKTAFWEAKFNTGSCSITATFAAIPNKAKNPRSVEKYILFDRKISYKGKVL